MFKYLKKFKIIVGIVAVFPLLFGIFRPLPVFAATSPTLGAAGSFSILAKTLISDVPASTVSGDVGLDASGVNYSGLTSAEVAGTIYATDGIGPDGVPGNNPGLMTTARNDNIAAFGMLDTGANADANCIGGILADNTDLSLLSPLGPGVYCSAGKFLLTTTLNLSGTGPWVFKTVSSVITSAASSVTGGDSCNIWWRVGSSATIASASSFKGNILALTSINLASAAVLDGRALAQTGQVTLDHNTITTPVCAAAAPAAGLRTGTINVVKTVINDNGGSRTVADFPLFVNGAAVTSGATNTFPAPAAAYTITETADANYTRTFSGDCDINGQLNLSPGDNRFCIVTNNDIGPPTVIPPIPPLIDLVKIPSPLSLPSPGQVTYSYILRNIGTVPVTNLSIVGDTCSPIVLISGDTNGDVRLDLNETWTYTCPWTLTETHTNTAVATGWANGVSATDIASSTVVVGMPIVPPLIHVVKTPSAFTLTPGGGAVTYTYAVTNPGTAPLSNVSITDDKCTGLPGRVFGHPGDLNKNDLLESNEAWSFTCLTNLTQTTTNIGTAEGSANALLARDFAIATVVVAGNVSGAGATPPLPTAGFGPQENRNIAWNFIVPSVVFAALLSFYWVRRKQTT